MLGKLDRDGLTVQGQGGKYVSIGVNAIGFADPGPTIRVALSPDGLQLNDAQGFETMLGVSDLVTQRTGRRTRLPSPP